MISVFVGVRGGGQGAASALPAGRSQVETKSQGVTDLKESGRGQLHCRWRRAGESSRHKRQRTCPAPLSG